MTSEQMTTDPAKAPQERVSAAVRREQILAAASGVFGERGYVGATTDQVAQAAGISQPYVVRMFGSKERLFVEVLDRALGTLLDAFRAVIAESKQAGDEQDALMTKLGAAYADLIIDRGILMSLMQGFVAGHEPAIGAKARAGFMELYTLLRNEAGFEPDLIVDFLAHGMLFNTLIAMRMIDQHDSDDPCIPELLAHTFRTKLDIVMNTVLGAPEQQATAAASRTRTTE
ncbi:TetR/AcrR family transcriptional regulator [Humibacter sp. RRB41]|uniref:TetR/AcrR family transcriptional regulator n=1 Tax=Humibacter sp. RRB41 TaxID=2919946 RepID=UPI001FAAEE95|nr:TetR/AcrR family transcriptional regulator [Humibacter sp. RRB41]